MSSKTADVLIVKSLDDDRRQILHDAGLSYREIQPFKTRYSAPPRLHREADENTLVVISSMRGFEAIEDQLQKNTAKWKDVPFATVGETSRTALEQLGLKVVLEAGSVGKLAPQILDYPTGKILYLCGDKRRPEMSESVAGRGKKYKEITVYRTELLYPKVEIKERIVLFFSPSGIESLLRLNKIPPDCDVASIGPTTTVALREHGLPPAFQSSAPDFSTFIKECKNHLES